MDSLRVIQYGLGPIGCAVARHVISRQGLELVAGVDIDQEKTGKDVGDVIGLDHQLGFPVAATLAESGCQVRADIALHTTNSYFPLFGDQIVELLEAGLDVVSTSEELSFPWIAHPDDAKRIDAAAKAAGKTVLGTGVNPGYLMDSLPLSLTAICQRVDRIKVTRHMNASIRRGPFQAKIGAGMTVEAFNQRMEAGRMGHVGLPESMGMIFDTLGRRLDRYESSVEPLMADREISTEHVTVKPGEVRGLKQVAHGYADGVEFVTLVFIAGLEEETNEDTIEIEGVPDLKVTMVGTHGDLATVAIAVNAIRRVRQAPAGLVTMRDLPIITRF